MAATITGDKQLDRKLKRLSEKAAKKAATAGVRAMLTPVAQALRKKVTASNLSTDLKRAARKTIGKRFSKGGPGKGQRHAKVGFGVGKPKGNPGRSGNNTGGVGISAKNIHWFVLGTRARQTKSGRSAGRIAAVFQGFVAQALTSSKSQALAAARKKIAAIIQKEASKR